MPPISASSVQSVSTYSGSEDMTWLIGLLPAALTRWWSVDAAKSIGVAILAIAGMLLVGFAYLEVKSSGAALSDARWLREIASSNEAANSEAAEAAQKSAAAAQAERDKAKADAARAIQRASTLQAELDRLNQASGDPVVFPKSLVRSLQ